jgi:hypothetical protein
MDIKTTPTCWTFYAGFWVPRALVRGLPQEA